ncbi:hypothetical protein ACHAXR_012629 [Thalassiosira sp. AJA248-18]
MVLLLAYILVASGGIADAFRLPSGSHLIVKGGEQRSRYPLPTLPKRLEQNNVIGLSLSESDTDAVSAEEMESLDSDLALEIAEALSMAENALAAEVEVSTEEDAIDEIANMLMERPPTAPPPLPLPPTEDPPDSVISLSLEDGADDEEDAQPEPPAPEPEVAVDLGEALQKKAAEEFEKLKNLIFGLNEDLAETEASAEKAEDAAAVLKKEIEESLQEREAMVKTIESEFAAEKERFVAQLEISSDELKVVMDQSAQNITDAKSKGTQGEEDLMSRIDSFKAAIEEVTAEAVEIKKDNEQIEQSRQSMMDKVIKEGKNRLAQFQKSFQFDLDYAKQINFDLKRRADETELKVRGVYDQINQMRAERVSLQEQIVDVEKNALEEIAVLERELVLDDDRYAATLQKERDRVANVIDVAYQAYAIKLCKKIVQREAVEDEYNEKLRQINMQVTAAKEKQESRVKEYLDKLEEKHKKERIVIYQEKFEAVSALRNQMNAELAIEYAKTEEIHKTMRAKIDDVRQQTTQMKAEFEKEMTKKRQIAKKEEGELLSQIEDVRVDMTDKMKTQRRLYDEKRSAYLEDMNAQISDSEIELRQRWRDLAGIKKSYNEVSAKKVNTVGDVAEQQKLIDSYESDRVSFRKSLRLTARVAKEKIGTKTRRLLKRDKKKAP